MSIVIGQTSNAFFLSPWKAVQFFVLDWSPEASCENFPNFRTGGTDLFSHPVLLERKAATFPTDRV